MYTPLLVTGCRRGCTTSYQASRSVQEKGGCIFKTRMYPEQLTITMAKELTDFGFKGLTSALEVKEIMDKLVFHLLMLVFSIGGVNKYKT